MRFEDVKYMVSQIKKVILLNESLGSLESATLIGGTIIIDSVDDELISCYFDKCKIISHVLLTVDQCHIDPLGEIEQIERIDKNTPHAIIKDCVFNLCRMPKGDYGDNYIKGKIQSSTPLHRSGETTDKVEK